MEVHGVLADQPQGEVGVVQYDPGDQSIMGVVKITPPAGVIHPMESPIHPNTETESMTDGVVLLADVRPVHIAQLVALVEVD